LYMKRLAFLLAAAALAAPFAAAQTDLSTDPDLHILPIQGNVYMMVGVGANIGMSVGPDRVILVGAGSSPLQTQGISKGSWQPQAADG